jgi:hypothetical protein
VSPHLISDPRGQTFPVGPLTVQCELTSSDVSTPVTDCCNGKIRSYFMLSDQNLKALDQPVLIPCHI